LVGEVAERTENNHLFTNASFVVAAHRARLSCGHFQRYPYVVNGFHLRGKLAFPLVVHHILFPNLQFHVSSVAAAAA